MQCPYCLSDVEEKAAVCKFCTRDLYLFRPMMERVSDLERQLEEVPSSDAYEKRISELQSIIEGQSQKQIEPHTLKNWIFDVSLYLFLPLALLLAAHALIAVVYDAKMVYLRIISMALPLPFGYFLFRERLHKLFPWFIGVIFLAISAVIGMSWVTSLVDHSPVWPQNTFEWREVLEYASSISFSFLTGMLLGGVNYANQQSHLKVLAMHPFLKVAVDGLGDGGSPGNLYTLMKKLQEYGGAIVALGTTALSIYTGLKGIIGS